MLVLTRHEGESIMIGDKIQIKVLRSRGQVRIGIEAPKNFSVHREEIYYDAHGSDGDSHGSDNNANHNC